MSKEQRRIHVAEVLEAAAGGTRTHMLHLLEGLDPARFRLTLIASCRRNPAFREDMRRLAARGVECIEIPMARAISPVRGALPCPFRHGRIPL